MDGSTNSLDDGSASSGAEGPDRMALMEGRLQVQEDEITLLKASLANALHRLHVHDQLIPLLRQHLIAVNPAAARALRQPCCADGFSRPWVSSSSSHDAPLHSDTSQVRRSSEALESSRVNGMSTSPGPKPSTCDRATQTEAPGPEPGPAPLALLQVMQSLTLEDALPDGAPSLQEQQQEEGAADREKEAAWTSVVEESIQPSTVRSLQLDPSRTIEESQASAPQTPSSGSPATPKGLVSSAGGPLSLLQEAEKKLVRRNSEKIGKDSQDKAKQKLTKKAASSANLLTRSPSLESRGKDLLSSTGNVHPLPSASGFCT